MNQPAPETIKSLQSAVQALKGNRPLRAEEICRDHLLLNAGSVDHMRVLGQALMKQGRMHDAEAQLREALILKPDFPQLYEDLASVLALQQRFEEAIPLFEKAIRLEPRLPLAHKKLGQALVAVGRGHDADQQFLEFFEKSPESGAIAIGAEHMRAGRKDEAMAAFRDVLRKNPNNVDAMRFLALVFWREEKNLGDAEAWVRRATSKAPDFTDAWLALGALSMEMNKNLESIEAFQAAVKVEPENPAAWSGLGNAYGHASYPEKGVDAFRKSLQLDPSAPGVQMGYAHVLKTTGDQEGALKAYREAIRLRPEFGEVYWSMANLKVFRFEDAEVAAMEEQLEIGNLNDSEEIHFRFSLGKAYEDKKDYDKAWHYYDTGNRKRRPHESHDPLEMEQRHQSIVEVFSREFIEEHKGNGCEAPDPILILGLPRSGSTLVEQGPQSCRCSAG
jgi:tetratricopeptide (TPR) repeat protein